MLRARSVFALFSLLLGCSSAHEVPDTSDAGPPRVFGEFVGQLPPGERQLCLPLSTHLDHMTLLERSASASCADRPGRTSTASGCRVARATSEGAAGFRVSPAAWVECAAGESGYVVELSPASPADATLFLNALMELPEAGAEEIPAPGAPSDPGVVGQRCVLPAGDGVELRPTEIYLSMEAPECEGAPCLAVWVDGAPAALPAEVSETQIICSCRCAPLEGDPSAPTCACPSGTTCRTDVFSTPGTGLGGGYCVPCRTEGSALDPALFDACPG